MDNGKRTIWLTERKARWLFIDAVIPVALVLIIWWPAGEFFLEDIGFAFERIVGGGDLLAIAFAFLVAHLTELFANSSVNLRTNTAANVCMGFTLFFAMVAAVMYGAIKIFHTKYGFPADRSGQLSGAITAMARFSLVYCGFIVGYIYLVKSWFEKVK